LRAGASRSGIAIGVALVAVLCVHGTLRAGRPTLSDAQSLFFNAQYNAAAALALELRTSDPDDLALCELAKYLDAHAPAITSRLAPGPNGPPEAASTIER
jgi:hypothetical protein